MRQTSTRGSKACSTHMYAPQSRHLSHQRVLKSLSEFAHGPLPCGAEYGTGPGSSRNAWASSGSEPVSESSNVQRSLVGVAIDVGH